MIMQQLVCSFCETNKVKVTPIKYRIGEPNLYVIKAVSLCDICLKNELSVEDISDKLNIIHIGKPLYEEVK